MDCIFLRAGVWAALVRSLHSHFTAVCCIQVYIYCSEQVLSILVYGETKELLMILNHQPCSMTYLAVNHHFVLADLEEATDFHRVKTNLTAANIA
jgi:hypothetical protein